MKCKCGCGQEANRNWLRGHWNKSEKNRKKISVREKGKSISEEQRKKISDTLKGRKAWNSHPYPIIPALCLCGCGEVVWNGNKYFRYHGFKYRTEEHCKKISEKKKGTKAWNKGYGDYIKGDKHPLWGKHHSNVSKKKMSIANSGKRYSPNTEFKKGHEGQYGKNNPMYGRIAAKNSGWGKGSYYISPLQGKIWLRSSYELAYAKYLDRNKILWLYELEAFDLGDTTYTPDFFLPCFEKFIEIKGWMKECSKQKLKLFQEQYPFDIEILSGKDLKEMGLEVHC